ADVEEAAAEGERHGEPGEDQRRREEQRLLQVEGCRRPRRARDPREEPVQAGAVEDLAIGVERVVTGRQDDQAADREREQRGDQRRRDAPGALHDRVPCDEPDRCLGVLLRFRLEADGRQGFGHAASSLSPRPPPVMAMPSSSSDAVGGYSPTICPSYMTRIRSDSERISSSSSETSRIARPSSLSATSRRWTNSIAPTSRPRVGCPAMRTVGLRSISRARTTFCWFPPESAPAGVCGPPPRTSNSLSNLRARAIRRPGNIQPNLESGALR